MKIEMSLSPGTPYETIEAARGTALYEIFNQYKGDEGYDAYAAIVHNDVKPLTYKIHKACNVQFLDVRFKSAFLIYQNSLVLLLIKAAKEVMNDETVEVRTTLNDGLFVALESHDIKADEIKALEKYMRELVSRDLPIETSGYEHTIDGFTARFYNHMVPSTGYLKKFKLKKYHDGLLLRYPQPEDPDGLAEFKDEPLIYQAYVERSKWNEMVGVKYISDLNAKIEAGEAKEMIQMSEALHDKKIVEIADAITTGSKRIILILGPSSSGKTTTAKRLSTQLQVNGLEPFYVSTDDYFVERSETPKDANGEYNFEGIDAIDVELFNEQMNALLQGEEVDVPEFDFIKGGKVFGNRITQIAEGQPIIIEGIHAFNPKLTGEIPDKYKYKIYISPLTQVNIDRYNRIPTTDARIIRRMIRDARTRGYNAEKTLEAWGKVHAGEQENIFPFSSEADVFFNTVHTYEAGILKKHAVPLLQAVSRDLPEYAEAHRLLTFFEGVADIEDESLVANNSILREFIGGSIYDK